MTGRFRALHTHRSTGRALGLLLLSSCVASAWTACGGGSADEHAVDVDAGARTSVEEQCTEERHLDEIPPSLDGFRESPLYAIPAASGTWTDDSAQAVLTLTFEDSATLSRWTCADRPDLPQPAGSGTSLEMTAHVTFRTSDGIWNEQLDVTVSMSEVVSDDDGAFMLMHGFGSVPLSKLRGSFELPAAVRARAADSVDFVLEYMKDHWTLRRSVEARNRSDGDVAPAWQADEVVLSVRG